MSLATKVVTREQFQLLFNAVIIDSQLKAKIKFSSL